MAEIVHAVPTKKKVENGIQRLWNKIVENRDTIIKVAPIVIGGFAALAKTVSRHARIHNEKVLKELYVWDPKLGLYWQLRKPMTNSQRLELDRRKQTGESVGNILAGMRILKR